MKRLTFSAVLVIILVAGIGCDGSGSHLEVTKLRVENMSNVDFSQVVIGFPGEEAHYGAVQAGRSSEYRVFETAYRYGDVKVKAANETYAIWPIDYVGEEPLGPGRFTYMLDIEGGDITLRLESD